MKLLFLGCDVFLAQNVKPFVGAVDLSAWLNFAVSDVSLCPFSESGGDLFDTDQWFVFVVALKVGIIGIRGITSFAVR